MQKTLFGLLFSLFTSVSTVAFAADRPAKDPIQIADNAPDSYVIKKGDTLWAISGKFLKQPWRWPEVWQLNKDEIRNPHLIYPGQVVYLDRNGPRLSLGQNTTAGNGKLSPQVYSKPADTPIASIPMELIRPFLVEPLVSESGDDNGLPSVVAMEEQRVFGTPGDAIFAKGVTNISDAWSVYRRGEPIRNPETKEILGYEAVYVAAANTTSAAKGDVAAELKVTSAKHEVRIGDRMMPAAKPEIFAYAPHAPAPTIQSSVSSIYGGVTTGGRYSVITVALGKNDGMEPGHVIGINRNRGTVTYKEDGGKEKFVLPDGRIGLAFVFRVFNKLSYALVVEASEPVYVGDKVVAP